MKLCRENPSISRWNEKSRLVAANGAMAHVSAEYNSRVRKIAASVMGYGSGPKAWHGIISSGELTAALYVHSASRIAGSAALALGAWVLQVL